MHSHDIRGRECNSPARCAGGNRQTPSWPKRLRVGTRQNDQENMNGLIRDALNL